MNYWLNNKITTMANDKIKWRVIYLISSDRTRIH